MPSSAPYTIHLPTGIDVAASYWHPQSRNDAKNFFKTTSQDSGLQGTVLQLDTAEPVCLNLAQRGDRNEVSAVSLSTPGRYAVHLGTAPQVQRILSQPVLLVSDLDDTLIGHTAEMDEGTGEFNHFWRASSAAAPAAKLVINTGRTLPLYEQAWAAKKHVLPPPDALVCGVGTKIYYPTTEGKWEEDKEWTCRMDEGWSYEQVRQALDAIIGHHGEDKVHYRADVELHSHKQTVMVHKEVIVHVTAALQAGLSDRAVQAVLITGGVETNWRFIDVVPLAAGKGAALKYLRDKMGFQEGNTVAAGDSANDCLMLEASHKAVVVANCVPEMRAWVQSLKPVARVVEMEEGEDEHNGQWNKLTVAAANGDDKMLVLASRPGSRGVLQGLAIMGFV